MTPDQWQKAKGFYDAVLKLSLDDRQRFLDENCSDKTIRVEIESLLANSEDAAEFLERPAIGEVANEIIGERERLVLGQSLGHYKIVKLLGAGGMGEVYLAEDTRLHRQVALKTLIDRSSGNGNDRQRFLREVHSASSLNHPNICTIYEVNDNGGVPFIAMEYIQGETLEKKIKTGLSLEQALDIGIQLADAIAEAHSHNIVHRDIKPSNIIVTPRGQAKVLDFGLAKKISTESEDETQPLISQAGTIIGTATYMSPEQARGNEVDARSDIFSFGIVLYEMIAGKPPFYGGTRMDVISSILHKEPMPVRRLTPELSPELERIISKTLRKDREERYQTAKDLLIDMKEIKQELEFQNKLGRDTWPNREVNDRLSDGESSEAIAPYSTSSAEYITGEIKKHKSASIVVLALVALTLAGAGLWYSKDRLWRTPQINSIAVLPFQNRSGDANLDYLSDGMSESLIGRLSELPDLKVISRSSSFKYRGENIDLQEAANKLGVQALVTGRLMRVGDNISIRVEMVDARDDRQLWGQQYDRKGTDALAIEGEIAQRISEKLRLKLTGAQAIEIATKNAVNSQAHDLFQRSRFTRLTGGTDGLKKAIEYLQQAITIDPTYALAYAEMSFDYSLLGGDSVVNPKDVTPAAEAAAQRSLELDENLAEAHLALAIIKRNAWEWASAERECVRSIELNPNLAQAHTMYSGYLSTMGRHEEAIAEAKRARELDPLSIRTDLNFGMAFVLGRRSEEAIEIFKKTLELNQDSADVHGTLAFGYLGNGNYAEAIREMLESSRLGGRDNTGDIYLAVAYAKAGNREKARSILKQLETSKDYVAPGEIAVLYATLGDTESAFASLEKAFAAHDLQLQYLKVDGGFDPIRDDPRFKNLLQRVGLPQ